MNSYKQNIAHQFGKGADHYHEKAHVQQKVAETLLKKTLNQFQNKQHQPLRILEIGAGTGFLTNHLQKTFPKAEILATDISWSMLHKNKANDRADNKAIRFVVMDGEQPAINQAKQFDLIISSMSVQWFESPAKSLMNLKTYLKEDGHLFYSALGKDSFKAWRACLASLDYKSAMMRISDYPGVFHKEQIDVSYPSAIAFLKSLKDMGLGATGDDYRPLNAGQMRRAASLLDKQEKPLLINWQIIYGQLSL